MKKLIYIVFVAALLFSCGEQKTEQPAKKENTSGLSDWELVHGIGPVKEKLVINALDQKLADEGEKQFDVKCIACHKIDKRYVGPPLAGVTKNRTPEYIMNMILNPIEMTKRHPEAKKKFVKYLTQMTFQNVTKDEARAILEFLRSKENVPIKTK